MIKTIVKAEKISSYNGFVLLIQLPPLRNNLIKSFYVSFFSIFYLLLGISDTP